MISRPTSRGKSQRGSLPDTIDRRGLRVFFRQMTTDPRPPSADLVVDGVEFQLFVVSKRLAYTADVVEYGPWQNDLDGQGEYRHACEWPIGGFWPAAEIAYRAVIQLVIDEVASRRRSRSRPEGE